MTRLVAAFVVAGLAACTSSSAAPRATAGEVKPLANKAAKSAIDPLAVDVSQRQPEVRLLEAGANPKALRIRYTVGTVVDVSLRMSMSTDVALDGVPIRRVLPPTVARVRLEVTHGSGRRYRISYELLDYELEEEPAAIPEVVTRYERELARAVGIKGSAIVDDRGRVVATDFDSSDGSRSGLAFLRDSLTKIAIPLPSEPIGVGGKWMVKEREVSDGMTSLVETTYEVMAIEGDAVTVRHQFVQNGVAGPVTSSELPSGTHMMLLELVGEGQGQRTLLLTNPRPRARSASRHVRSRVELSSTGSTQKIDSGLTLDLALID